VGVLLLELLLLELLFALLDVLLVGVVFREVLLPPPPPPPQAAKARRQTEAVRRKALRDVSMRIPNDIFLNHGNSPASMDVCKLFACVMTLQDIHTLFDRYGINQPAHGTRKSPEMTRFCGPRRHVREAERLVAQTERNDNLSVQRATRADDR
jgi:hypothetical protein